MVLSIPLGFPWAIFSDSKAMRLISSFLSFKSKCLFNALIIETAMAADPPRPIPLGISEKTSIFIPRSVKPSLSKIRPAGFSNDCLLLGSLSN